MTLLRGPDGTLYDIPDGESISTRLRRKTSWTRWRHPV